VYEWTLVIAIVL